MTDKLIRLPEVLALTGLSRSRLYEKVREGTFEAPVRIDRRSVAWSFIRVQAWIAERIRVGRDAA